MKVASMQPYLFPYLGYMQLIHAVDKFVILDDVQYINKGWINKNRLLVNGKSSNFVFSLKADSPHIDINKRYFSEQIDCCKEKLLKTATLAYKKAPYFRETISVMEHIVNNPERNVAKYVENSIFELCHHLQINSEILISSELDKDNEKKGQALMINICKRCKGDVYINAIGGQALYAHEIFRSQGIELYFIQMNEIVYKQYSNEFIPNLSIIDVLMFNGKKDTVKLLDKYKLIQMEES